ncbi:DUF2497 domain-containing protein [Phenylobacterium sp.]|jgi:hypothetical protein|uniref:DUF2497 domain-containing protein n=1 Tax=Phenylobacterium sp. TaxID=1871053 RepID=UPI002F3F0D0D
MSEQPSQEPTMEEILASIRRIISEDDAPAPEAADAAPEEKPIALTAEPELEPEAANEPEPEPVAVAAPVEPDLEVEEEEALELTDKVETHGDLDVVSPAVAPPILEPEPLHNLVSERAANAAASSFGQLSAAIGVPKSDRTLEDVVRDLIRPLLQQWLDENLPAIVQQTVEAEVERIARSRVR